jgi:hypothetical protein
MIKSAPGYVPGHQFLTLANREQTAASRVAVEAFLKKTSAQLWIEHDFEANATLKKAPAYYE